MTDRPQDETRTIADLADRRAPEGQPQVARASLLGRYLILDPIGQGGMGRVYEAYDPELDRKVAIKVLRHRGAAADQARLQREAQATARLSHPNVVTVHDVGLASGRVFMTMELLSGQPLDQWIDSGPRNWKETVRVFLQAGRGLAEAHRAGVVHHDFKPSNAFLGEDGRVRLLDFGVSEAVLPGGASATPTSTHGGTSGYMAPERRAGHGVDARSDQYSFSASLHLALLGNLPREPRETDRRRLPRALRPILDRGLTEHPQDRYSSMEDLLTALEGTVRSRHWIGVAAAALLASALLLLPRGSGQTLCAEGPAELEPVWNADRRGKLENTLAGQGDHHHARGILGLLDRFAASWTEAYGETCRATHVAGHQSADLLDLRMTCLASRRDDFDAVIAALEGIDPNAVSRAVGAVAALPSLDACADTEELLALPPMPSDPQRRLALEALRKDLALARADRQFRQSPELDHAAELVARAEELGYAPLIARAHLGRAVLLDEHLADAERAPQAYRRALASAFAARSQRLAAQALIGLADFSGQVADDFASAAEWAELAQAVVAGLGAEKHPDVAADLENALGIQAWKRGEVSRAREHFLGALEATQQAFGETSPRLRQVLNNLGALTVDDPLEALPYLELSIAVEEATFGPDSWSLGPALVNLSSIYAELQRYDEALAACRRAEGVLLPVHGEDHPYLIYPRLQEGLIHVAEERSQAARTVLEPLASSAEKSLGKGHPILAQVLQGLADAHLLADQLSDDQLATAESLLLEAQEIAVALPPDHPNRASVAISLGQLRLAQGRHGEARSLFSSALEKLDGSGRREHLRAALGLARSLLAAGRRQAAVKALESTLDQLHQPDPRLLAAAHFTLARALWNDDPERALELAEEARQASREWQGPGAERHQAIQQWLATRNPS
ncbi:MAG: serine/threonine-protein kinase [Acidobacteriota bacterium]